MMREDNKNQHWGFSYWGTSYWGMAYWGNIPEGSIVINYTPKACRIFTVEKDDRNFEARRGFYGK